MGYQPRGKTPRRTIHEYRKPLREVKEKRRSSKRTDRFAEEPRHSPSEREISESTLKRLHTLGNQKFGSSPFSVHFDRWLISVETVLDEFKANVNIGIDQQFQKESADALSVVRKQLEEKREKEETVSQEAGRLTVLRKQLEQINQEYVASSISIKVQKKREVKKLQKAIDNLKVEQDIIIRIKAGLFHRVSKKKREQKEIAIAEELNNKQNDLELTILKFNSKLKELQDDYEIKREPVLEKIKTLRKMIRKAEEDDSLEDRWFACEALIDAVNGFLQRKTAQSKNHPQ